MTWRVLLADDEAPARAKVRRLLANDGRFVLAGEARDGLEAVAAMDTLRPDLAILDVQMPGLTGFEVLQHLGARAPLVLFATAFEQYALQAFEAHAVDYLLKPFDGPRLARALDRCAALLAAGGGDPAQRSLAGQLACAPLRRLLVRQGEGLRAVSLAEVGRLSAEGKLVRLHGPEGRLLLRQSLASLEAQLDPRQFCRIHRGDLVNLAWVQGLEPFGHGDSLVLLKDGSAAVLSRTHRERFLGAWRFSAGSGAE